MKKRLLLFKYQIKKCVKTAPLAILIMMITTGIILGLGVVAIKIIDNNIRDKINVALVVCDKNEYVDAALAYLFEDEKVKEMCSFVRTDEDNAYQMLRSGEVSSVVLIPAGFFNGIMYGNNISPQVILKESGQISGLSYFQEMITAGSRSLAIAQAAIYAANDICARIAPGIYYDTQDYLNRVLFIDVLQRNAVFNIQAVSENGEINTVWFYICSGIITLILITMAVCGTIFVVTDEEIQMLGLNGIKPYEVMFIKYTGNILFFVLLLNIGYLTFELFGSKKIFLPYLGYVSLIAISLVTFVTFWFNILKQKNGITYVGIITTLIFMVLSGCVIPLSFLPSIIRKIGIILPTRPYTQAFALVLQNTFNGKTVLIGNETMICIIVWDLVFIIAMVIQAQIRNKMNE